MTRRAYEHETDRRGDDNDYRVPERTDQPHGLIYDPLKCGLFTVLSGSDTD